MQFKEYLNDNLIVKALEELNIIDMTEIQEKAIPHILLNRDIIGLAQTGTGKTFAYSLPIINNLDLELKATQALILCPTRELAIQVSNEIKKVLKYKKDVNVATIYGGESYDIQIRELKKKPQIVVGTPGRVIDHLNRSTLKLGKIKSLILDEADEMLKMGFKDDLETILNSIPNEHQTALFSATMAPFIKEIAKNYQNDPEIIEIKKKSLTVEAIDQKVYYVKREQKKDLLIRLLDYYKFNSVIIFANTKTMVDDLQTFLLKHDYKADALHGDLKQAQRDKVMNAFKAKNLEILVCTDVAARGIDVKGLEAIINFDLPQEDELYVHRIGRTGRAGENGLSLSLATKSERRKVHQIELYTRSKMTVSEAPSREQIENKLLDNLYDEIMANMDRSIRPNLKIINKLAHEENDPANIINALLEIILKNKRKKYAELEKITFNNDIRKEHKHKDRPFSREASYNKDKRSNRNKNHGETFFTKGEFKKKSNNKSNHKRNYKK